MTTYVSADLRRLVEGRANHICEYCLIHVVDTYFGCQIEHIIAEKHGGPTIAENLAYACTLCNRAKGTDLGTIIPPSNELTRFYNPRIDRWTDHFELEGALIKSKTLVGEATVRILRFNSFDRIIERRELLQAKRYPSSEALKILQRSIANPANGFH